MSPNRKAEYPIEIHPDYIAELRRRVETGPGFGPVADAAGMSRTTLWRVLNGGGSGGHRATADAVERARIGLASLQEDLEPMPPPVVSVRGAAQHAWILIGEALFAEDPDAFASALKSPDAVREAIRQQHAARQRR